MPEPFNLNILLGPSRSILFYLVILHGLSGLALYIWLPKFIVLSVTGLAFHGCWLWRRYLASLPKRVLFSANTSSWQLQYDHETQLARLDSAVVWRLLLVLRFVEPTKAKSATLVVVKDSCHSDDFRRLRIALNAYKAFSG